MTNNSGFLDTIGGADHEVLSSGGRPERSHIFSTPFPFIHWHEESRGIYLVSQRVGPRKAEKTNQ
jgi:hypothetical protein